MSENCDNERVNFVVRKVELKFKNKRKLACTTGEFASSGGQLLLSKKRSSENDDLAISLLQKSSGGGSAGVSACTCRG